jgi:hypothetical protein
MRMGLIFSNATKVLAWIGDEVDDSQTAMAYLGDEIRGDRPNLPAHALSALFRRLYWKRAVRVFSNPFSLSECLTSCRTFKYPDRLILTLRFTSESSRKFPKVERLKCFVVANALIGTIYSPRYGTAITSTP